MIQPAHKQKSITLSIITCLLFVLIACNNSPNDRNVTPSTKQKTITLESEIEEIEEQSFDADYNSERYLKSDSSKNKNLTLYCMFCCL